MRWGLRRADCRFDFMKKATAIAPSNIAFVKYWGLKDSVLRLPENGSISMNLSGLTTKTTVEFIKDLQIDDIVIDGKRDEKESARVSKHLDRVRLLAGISTKAKVVSENSFPSSTGLSSSASGFAALTVAAAGAAGLSLSEKELSILARQGSGSACRSIPDGFVEWATGETSEVSFARSLFPSEHWDIVDLVALVSNEKKEISTSEGMSGSRTSPFFVARQAGMARKLDLVRAAIEEKDFVALGELAEAEALELHAIMLTSSPSLIYWTEGTLQLIKKIKQWRSGGLEVYFSLNTGQDVHVLCCSGDSERVRDLLSREEKVKEVIINRPSSGTRLVDESLF